MLDKDLILAKLEENPELTVCNLSTMFNEPLKDMRDFIERENIKTFSFSEKLALRNKILCTQPPIEISPMANQLILGSMLGDGSIIRKRTNCILVIRHSLVQKQYVLHKYKLFEQSGLHVKYSERTNSYRNGIINGRIIKDNGYCQIVTKVNQSFNKYREDWYNPKKEVPDTIYELGPIGLAIWYMDDGAIHHPTGAYFSTNGFNHNSQLKLQDMMIKNFGLTVHIHKNKDKEILYLIQKDYNKFVDIIKEFVCPEMNYKIIGHNKQGELLES